MSTYIAKSKDLKTNWYIVDADGQTLGRLATQIAHVLRGKNMVTFTPHMDMGNYVIVTNAKKIKVTGNKLKDKCYHSYSGYQSGLKTITLEKLLAKAPDRVIKHAVKRMLPKGPLGRKLFKKLKVYADDKHPHVAQNPKPLITNEA